MPTYWYHSNTPWRQGKVGGSTIPKSQLSGSRVKYSAETYTRGVKLKVPSMLQETQLNENNGEVPGGTTLVSKQFGFLKRCCGGGSSKKQILWVQLKSHARRIEKPRKAK